MYERLLLVRRVLVDNEQAARVAENEFHRSRWWAYKWLKRFDESGLDGLKDQQRTGRPPEVSEDAFTEIKKELSENAAGWRAKEVMNIIYERTGIRYHEVHVYRLLHKWGFSPKVPRPKICKYCVKERGRSIQKRAKQIISSASKDFIVAVEDESIFIHDTLIKKRMWTPPGKRPIVTLTGSHQKTCVFGTLTMDGKQLFRHYDVFNQFSFLKYLKELHRKFRKLLLFIDRAAQHRSSIIIKKYLKETRHNQISEM